jgi:hypothetical protein
MCKEMPVIPVNKVVDPKIIIGKKWRAEEEERHKGSLTPPPKKKKQQRKLFLVALSFQPNPSVKMFGTGKYGI